MFTKVRRLAGVLLFSVISIITSAQNKEEKIANSLLWKIEGNGLEKLSYLFATVHMICEGDFFMPEKVKTAVAATSRTFLEINLADPDMAAKSQQKMISFSSLLLTVFVFFYVMFLLFVAYYFYKFYLFYKRSYNLSFDSRKTSYGFITNFVWQ